MRCGWKAKEPLGGQGRGMDGVEIIGRSSNVIKSRGRPRAWARSRTGSTAEAEVEREVSRLALKLWRPLEGQKSLRQHLVSLLHH